MQPDRRQEADVAVGEAAAALVVARGVIDVAYAEEDAAMRAELALPPDVEIELIGDFRIVPSAIERIVVERDLRAAHRRRKRRKCIEVSLADADVVAEFVVAADHARRLPLADARDLDAVRIVRRLVIERLAGADAIAMQRIVDAERAVEDAQARAGRPFDRVRVRNGRERRQTERLEFEWSAADARFEDRYRYRRDRRLVVVTLMRTEEDRVERDPRLEDDRVRVGRRAQRGGEEKS